MEAVVDSEAVVVSEAVVEVRVGTDIVMEDVVISETLVEGVVDRESDGDQSASRGCGRNYGRISEGLIA